MMLAIDPMTHTADSQGVISTMLYLRVRVFAHVCVRVCARVCILKCMKATVDSG